MKVLSLFDGISCGMLALQRAGIPVECYDAFEIDKYAVTVSKRNFPVIVHHGNVYGGDFTQFKGYDLLLGGSPCTYWSIAKPVQTADKVRSFTELYDEYQRRHANDHFTREAHKHLSEIARRRQRDEQERIAQTEERERKNRP